ncbi:hypothetical protein DMUE_2027 [Dictyocoela muelleri]|nr:hypothetical protein DMUE_2027 [Dictyocoela muelleri]
MDTPRKISNKIKKYISSSLSSISSFIGNNKNDNKEDIFSESEEFIDDLSTEFESPNFFNTNKSINNKSLNNKSINNKSLINKSLNNKSINNKSLNNKSLKGDIEKIGSLYVTPPNEFDNSSNSLSDSIILPKEEYEEMQSQLKSLHEEVSMNKRKEDEYKKLLMDFDNTISFMMSKNNSNGLLESVIREKNDKIKLLSDELEKYKINEEKLKGHVVILQNDLLRAEERANAYKDLAKEKINSVNKENEKIFKMYENVKNQVKNLKIQVNELFMMLIEKTSETSEVVGYCKELLNFIDDLNDD